MNTRKTNERKRKREMHTYIYTHIQTAAKDKRVKRTIMEIFM